MADIFTSLVAKGTESELTAILNVLRKYSCDAKVQYNTTHDCWYLDTEDFTNLSQEKINALIGTGILNIMIPGPYGVVRDPYSDYDVLFTDLADAAPMARFDIKIEGFDAGGNISSTAVLREGKLYFDTDYRDHGSAETEETQAGSKILAAEDETAVLGGITFVITGDLKKFKNRDAITIFIEERGGIVGSGVTKKTNYLINNAKRSKTAKNNKAKELGIPVITEAEFLEQFGLSYQPCKSKNGKMYEAGYYDPICHVFQPPRKLKKEPLTLQLLFECADQSRHLLQIDLDVSDYMGLSCTPDKILSCKDLEELEALFVNSVTDQHSRFSNREQYRDHWRIDEFQKLFIQKWLPIKAAIGSMENLTKITLKRIDVRKDVRFVSWARECHKDLKDLVKKAALCKKEQKAENAAILERYLDEQKIWFPWADSPDWPTDFCGYKERAVLDWRSLTEDAGLFAKLIITEDIPALDHGEEVTIVDFLVKEYQQSACYFPGW